MEPSRTTLRRPSRAPWIVVAIALVGAVAFAAVRWLWHEPALPPPPAAAPAAAPPVVEAPAGPAVDPDPARQRALLEAVSPHALYRRALGEGDPLRRIAIAADNLAEGVSPRKQLALLAPAGPFSVVRSGGRIHVAPASYARYDAFATAVASVDAAALATAYRALHRVLEVAYRALGYPDAALDRVARRALERIAAAPVREGELEVVEVGGIYEYADPRLEDLGEVEQHVLRMGPRNGKLLKAKAREILEALQLPAVAEPAGQGR